MSKTTLNINFIEKKHYAFGLSATLTLLSLLLIIFHGLNLSIDFQGGTIIEFWSKNTDVKEKIHTSFSKEYGDIEVQKLNTYEGDCCYYGMKLGVSGTESVDAVTNIIKQNIHDAEFIKIDYIGPKIGAEFTEKAVKAIVFSLLAMMIYVWFRFDFKFGLGVMLALFHDVLITLGFFSICGFSFDLTSIAVILTVVGYSINDSIVIYDRIRENLRDKIELMKRHEFGLLINRSIHETLSRTIMTSLTTLIVCIALLIFGGEALRGFSAALSFGIAFGTYSSIYVSAPVLIFFARK